MYTYNARIARVIDGDTIEAYVDLGFNTTIKETFRLYGIDTPELRTRDLEEKKKGIASREYLILLLQEAGEKLVIHTMKDKKGKYGRYLATLFKSHQHLRDGNSINAQLVKDGYAKADLRG